MVRWRSIRDRYKKEFNKEVNRPSGSGGARRQPYRYSAALEFLRQTLQLRSNKQKTGSDNTSECRSFHSIVLWGLPALDPCTIGRPRVWSADCFFQFYIEEHAVLGHLNLLVSSIMRRSLKSRPPRVPLFLLQHLVRKY